VWGPRTFGFDVDYVPLTSNDRYVGLATDQSG
jgi:hypothetical protein